MTFDEILGQAIEMLQRRTRLTYRTLKRQFALDDEALEDLTYELIKGQRLAVDDKGEVLVWVGDRREPPALTGLSLQAQAPASYTPPHLAERIRAEQAAMES